MNVRLKAMPLTRTINKFLKHNFKHVSAKLDTDFCYYPSSHKIGYNVVTIEKFDLPFMDYAKELGLNIPIGVWTLSLLHEVGHYFTYHLIDDDTRDYCYDTKSTLCDTDEDTCKYFRLPDERLATLWAVQYANSHAKEIVKFEKKLDKRFARFYKKVHVSD